MQKFCILTLALLCIVECIIKKKIAFLFFNFWQTKDTREFYLIRVRPLIH